MEALNFLKFWRERSVAAAGPAGAPTPVIEVEEEEEDSFFDLELSVSDGGKEQSNNLVPDRQQQQQQQQPTHDVFSKRKIIPSSDSPRRDGGDALFLLTRVNGSKSGKKQSPGKELALSGGAFSKRFSTDTIQKYLNRIKPRKSSKANAFSCSPASSPASSPAEAFSPAKSFPGGARLGLRAVYKNLGKTKSATAAVGIESPARRDDSLIQQNDSIQSAILHCKRSFNSSRESSMLSRSSSDSIKSLSSDCSVLPRYSSDKWIDSARNSIEDGCFISK